MIKKIRFIDHSNPTSLGTAMASFAVDDALCQSIGRQQDEVACRFWVHDNTVVLGILDCRLPNIAEAVTFFYNKKGLMWLSATLAALQLY